MKSPFEFFRPSKQEIITIEELPSPIMNELKKHSINSEDVKKISVSNSVQHIDGRQFYSIQLKDGRSVKVDFIGEGYVVEKFEIE